MCSIDDRLKRGIATAISAAFMLVVLTTVTAQGAAIVGHWKFDGDLTDSVGTNDATVPTPGSGTNNAFAGTANGISGGAAAFDGVQDALTLPNAKTQLITDDTYSLSFWERSPAGTNTGYFVGAGHTGGYEALFMRRTATSYDGGHDPSRFIAGIGAVSRQQWHHVAITLDSFAVARLYIDGVHKGTNNAAAEIYDDLGSSVWLGNRPDFQRDFDGLIDDVQIYDAPLDAAQIQVMAYTPGVAADGGAVYREIFPSDGTSSDVSMATEGWKAHYGSSATSTTGPVVQHANAATAYGVDRPPVNSDPQHTGATAGYLNNYGGPTTSDGYLYWTEELPGLLLPSVSLDPDGVDLITFDTRMNSTSYVSRVALQIEDEWFVSADFDNPAGTSAFTHTVGGSAWQTNVLDFDTAEWAALTFDPGNTLLMGTTEVFLPNDGRITAFGIFQDTHTRTQNARFDNFTILGTVVPEPGSATVLLVLCMFGLLPAIGRRRR